MQDAICFNSNTTVLFEGNPHVFDLKEHIDPVRQSTIDELAREALNRSQSYCFAVVKEKSDETHTFVRLYDGISFFECANWIGTAIESKEYITPLRTEAVNYTIFEITPHEMTPFPLSRDPSSGIEKKLMFWKFFELAYFPPSEQHYWQFVTAFAKDTIKDYNPETPLTDKQIIKAHLNNLGFVIQQLVKDPNPLAKPRLEHYAKLWKALS